MNCLRSLFRKRNYTKTEVVETKSDEYIDRYYFHKRKLYDALRKNDKTEFYKIIDDMGGVLSFDNMALVLAIDLSDSDLVIELIERGADIETCFNVAKHDGSIYFSDVKLFEYFIEKGVDIHKNDMSSIVLANACSTMNLDVVKFLIENGANINHLNNYLLHTAITNRGETSQADKVIYFSRDGNDIITRFWANFFSNRTQLEMVKLLVENGADISEDNLLSACRIYSTEVIKYLVEKGADISAIKDVGIKKAERHGYLNTIRFLIENGADSSMLEPETLKEIDEGLERSKRKFVICAN